MINSVKILLYPEENKSLNGSFFEKLIRDVFSNLGYEIISNINFTGLEIDLLASHSITKENIIIECKAKVRVQSSELKNFAFNVSDKDVDKGYFFYTEELQHQAAGLVEEWKGKEKYKKLCFIGPEKIIDILVKAGKISMLDKIKCPTGFSHDQKFLVYSYFGIYYILLGSKDSKQKNFFVYDAITTKEVDASKQIARNAEYDSKKTIEQYFKDTIEEIKNVNFKIDNPKNIGEIRREISSDIEISPSFQEFLADPGARYTHPYSVDIKLIDIFIAPDLVVIDSNKKIKQKEYLNLEKLNLTPNKANKILLLGEYSSGKTIICKYLFQKYYDCNYIPLLFSGIDFKANKFNSNFIFKLLKVKFEEQYLANVSIEDLKNNKIVIIIDDFNKNELKNSEKSHLFDNICNYTENIIVIGDIITPIEILIEGKNSKKLLFEDFTLYKISQLGVKLRKKIIYEWNRLGLTHSAQEEQANMLLKKDDIANKHINNIIGKNNIPTYPFYLLTILQSIEVGTKNNFNYSLYGAYYQQIIEDSLNKILKSESKEYLDLFLNYMTELAYHFFDKKIDCLSEYEFSEFNKKYYTKYDVKYNFLELKNVLNKANLISINNGIASIKYKYVFLYFTAKHYSNNIEKTFFRDSLASLIKNLHIEEYSSIIMFIIHLTKSDFVVDSILKEANNLYSDNIPSKLEEDISEVNKIILNLPREIIKSIDKDIDVKKNREISLEREFLIEESFAENNESTSEEENAIDMLANINAAFKIIEILGEIAKKYWGSLEKEKKNDIVIALYELGLRTLNYLLLLIGNSKEDLIDVIKIILGNKYSGNETIPKEVIEKETQNFISRYCYMASYGVIKKISDSVAFDKLESTFENILDKKNTNAIKLINIAIKLEIKSELPIQLIKTYVNEMRTQYLPILLLHNMSYEYVYMYHTTHIQKSQLNSIFSTEIEKMYKIDSSSKEKKQ